jgi:Rab3 GTPase-activating protein catalytic subunit
VYMSMSFRSSSTTTTGGGMSGMSGLGSGGGGGMTTTNTNTNTMDEYTDYSCSTSTERLARDVETALRSWHVVDGSDRHASMSTMSSRSTGASLNCNDEKKVQTNQKHLLSNDHSPYSSKNIRLIRSQTIAWHLSFYLQSGLRISCPFELELSLWDGPAVHSAAATAAAPASSVAASDNDTMIADGDSSALPFSLQRQSLCSNAGGNEDDIFANFSTLFGIGQHITLTPTLAELQKQQQQQQQQHHQQSTNADASQLWEYLSDSIHSRHASTGINASATCATTILSTWLQTALNWAAAECHCYIPIFGIWSLYQPNTSSLSSINSMMMLQNNSKTSNMIPPWLRIAQKQHFSPQLVSSKQQQQASSRSPLRNRRSNTNRRDNSHRHSSTDLHLNRRYTPPILSGTCISQDYETIFWTTFQPLLSSSSSSRQQSPPPPPRLTEWGTLLLRHCPRNSSSSKKSSYSTNPSNKVALWTARHVYSWNKAPSEQSRLKRRRPLLAAIFQVEKQTAEWRRPTTISQHENQRDTLAMMDMEYNNKNNNNENMNHEDDVKLYRLDCRQYALQLMEQAAGATIANPMWGPAEDPIADIYATILWSNNNNKNNHTVTTNRRQDNANANNVVLPQPQPQPLLYLPLNIRSKRGMSHQDITEAETTMEHGILDPFRPTGSFTLQIHGDIKLPHASLAASQRCILAALIRTATLPSETLLWHLVDEKVMDRWDSAAGNVIAATLADKAKVSASTKALVAAMDWADAPEDMIETHQADELVQAALDPTISLGFPCPPEPTTTSDGGGSVDGGSDGRNQNNKEKANDDDDVDENDDSPLWQPLLRSAPVGRLVSLLLVHMAKVRSPCSMVLVFSAFIEELRRRWDYRESLPNMNYVPGLDPLLSLEQVQLATKRCSISSTVSDLSKATLAAHVNASEPDPDDFHCLIGQKLQVFNLCMETAISQELRLVEQMERQNAPSSPQHGPNTYMRQQQDQDRSTLYAALQPTSPNPLVANSPGVGNSGATMSGANRHEMVSIVEGLPAISTIDMSSMSNNHNNSQFMMGGGGGGQRFGDSKSVATGRSMATKSQLYFDADEGDFDDFLNDDVEMDEDSSTESVAPEGLWMQQQHGGEGPSGAAAVANAVQGRNAATRRGARCPIHGMMLANGSQAYAPYLQRPPPMTDDIIAQRRLMLNRQDANILLGSNSTSKLPSSQERRLEVVHRLQRDKLLSDMSAFKAANPNSTFEDFIAWYGKPTNPLEEYEVRRLEQQQKGARVGASTQEKLESQQEQDIQAKRIVEQTQAFWLQTWKEARAIPANEQEPLFNAENTVEVSLDYLETLHPAVLLCNVMSVNLSVAYFTLLFSAGDALRIAHVKSSLSRLRRKIEIALKLLSLDATLSGTRQQQGGLGDARPGGYSVLSLQTISACEAACQVMQDTEVFLARAVSLLHKFPKQYRLIDAIFQQPDGARINVDDSNAQHQILRMILQHQQQQEREHNHPQHVSNGSSQEEQPVPSLRDYVLRNMDETNPCQLCVRYGDKGIDADKNDEDDDGGGCGGLLLAVARTRQASS